MKDCLFCKIVSGEIPAQAVYETDTVLAFPDISPQAPTHILVIPKAHTASAATADNAVLGDTFHTATLVAKQAGLEANGYRLVTNIGQDGGQSVGHLHVHVLGGRPMTWPPG